jgi:hypothetical protein
MSSTPLKNAMRDPSKVPSALDVDQHLNQYSRYARMVRGAARVAGLSSRLSWTNQGWVEQFRMPYGAEGEEAVLGMINLVRVPPRASIPLSRALDEVLSQRVLPEPIRAAIAAAEGTQTKWIEAELTGPLAGDLMAALIALKTDIVRSGAVPIPASERFKPVARPEGEAPRLVRPVSSTTVAPAAVRSVAPAKIAKPVKAPAPAKAQPPKPSKASKPVKVAAVKRAAKPVPAKKKPAKPAARSISLKKPAAKKASAKSAKATSAKRR